MPKKFGPQHGGWAQEMAELGFIVVQMDGMGTSNRSKKFHDVCWKNLGDGGPTGSPGSRPPPRNIRSSTSHA